jgi:hypothetical protein
VRRGCGLAVAKGQRGGAMRACERHQDRRLTGGNAVVPVRPENWRGGAPTHPDSPRQQGGKEKAGKTRRPTWKEEGEEEEDVCQGKCCGFGEARMR